MEFKKQQGSKKQQSLKKLIEIQKQQSLEQLMEKIYKSMPKRKLIFKIILSQLFELKKETDANTRRHKINNFISNTLLIHDPQSPLQEIAFNWIKKQIEHIQNEDIKYVCCYLHYQLNSETKGIQNESQEFKYYYWPLTNESIQHHIRKTIVGFLNSVGGIIYIGLTEKVEKNIKVEGISLSRKQKIEVLEFFLKQIVDEVYPQEKRSQEELESIEQNFQTINYEDKKSYEFKINKYVSVDFLDVYQKETFFNARKEDKNLYVVRVKVKQGNPFELYHLINKDKKIPETYMREDKSVMKKSLTEFYDKFYERMKDRVQGKIPSLRTDFHTYCRFVMKIDDK